MLQEAVCDDWECKLMTSLTLYDWERMFAATVKQNALNDLRQEQTIIQAAYSLTRGTVSEPLTQVGKWLLGRAFLTQSPELFKAKAYFDDTYPGQWKNVEKEVDSWLNPVEKKPEPIPDRRKYTYPCGHKGYHFEAGPRGLIVCFTVGCGRQWKIVTDEHGKVKLQEYRGGALNK